MKIKLLLILLIPSISKTVCEAGKQDDDINITNKKQEDILIISRKYGWESYSFYYLLIPVNETRKAPIDCISGFDVYVKAPNQKKLSEIFRSEIIAVRGEKDIKVMQGLLISSSPVKHFDPDQLKQLKNNTLEIT